MLLLRRLLIFDTRFPVFYTYYYMVIIGVFRFPVTFVYFVLALVFLVPPNRIVLAAGWKDIPPEVKAKMFHQLSPEDQLKVRSVNKEAHNIIHDKHLMKPSRKKRAEFTQKHQSAANSKRGKAQELNTEAKETRETWKQNCRRIGAAVGACAAGVHVITPKHDARDGHMFNVGIEPHKTVEGAAFGDTVGYGVGHVLGGVRARPLEREATKLNKEADQHEKSANIFSPKTDH